MAAYATATDMAAYIEGWVTDDAQALGRLLERASRDVDEVLGPMPVLTTGTFTGFKLDPTTLADWEADALARATCAQAEHRFTSGEAALRGDGTEAPRLTSAVKGPDFEEQYVTSSSAVVTSGGTGRFSPKLPGELAPIRHLRGLTARMRP